uniref:40S ribosomal protein S15D n=1 Tax=Rhizophora mucronata TaxID=61149 RepID=A0A2P2L4W6_RHIMU
MSNHFGLDFNLIEGLAIVDPNNTSNHLRYNNHIAQMSSDWFWLLARRSLPFSFAKFLDEGHGLPLQASLEPPAGTGMEELDELISGHVKESIQVDSSETELLERSLLRLPHRRSHCLYTRLLHR